MRMRYFAVAFISLLMISTWVTGVSAADVYNPISEVADGTTTEKLVEENAATAEMRAKINATEKRIEGNAATAEKRVGGNAAPAEKRAEFNVATFNLRQKNERDSLNGDNWMRRCPVIAQLIRFHEFNIFGTQEGFKDQLEDLKSRLPNYEYTGVAREDGKNLGEHSAIFYDTTMFELLDHGDFWLSETPEKPGLGWDAACVRICSWGKFRHRASGKVFQFFNLHLDHVGKTARVESVLLVQKKMKEFGLNLPTFLTGDFNVDQTHDLYEVLSASDFLKDSFTTADFVYALNGTINSYNTEGYTESRIDHIFVTDDVVVEKYGVLTDSYRTPTEDAETYTSSEFPDEVAFKTYRTRLPSDHFPVKIKIKL